MRLDSPTRRREHPVNDDREADMTEDEKNERDETEEDGEEDLELNDEASDDVKGGVTQKGREWK